MTKRLGNRGLVLLLIGFLWVMTAWTVHQAPVPNTRPPVPHEQIPPIIRELAWLTTGLAGIVFAFFKQGRDRWGFFALMIMPAERAFSWGAAIIFHFTSDEPYPPLPLSVGQFLIWLAVSILIYVIARWRESHTYVVLSPEDIR